MESKIWDNISSLFELELPEDLVNLEQHIEYVVPRIQSWSEDLCEEKYYVGKRWKEIRDTDTYHEVVLHIFMPDGEYLISIDGDITKGIWRYLKDTNTLIVEYGGRNSLYDLTFLNDDFFILKKHGDQSRKGKQTYYVYGNEKTTYNLTWQNAMEKLYNIYRNNSRFSFLIFIVALLIFIIIYISLK